MRAQFLKSIYDASTEILGRPEADNLFSSAVGWTGKDDLDGIILNSDFLFDLSGEFSIKFHQNTAKGLLIRIGDAAFSFLCKRIDDLNELGSIENRLKPSDKRFVDSFDVLAENLSRGIGMKIKPTLQEKGSYCLEFFGDKAPQFSDLYLYFFGGILRAFGLWLDSRKKYTIDVGKTAAGGMENRVCLLVQTPD